jgi:hypothetical protein
LIDGQSHLVEPPTCAAGSTAEPHGLTACDIAV